MAAISNVAVLGSTGSIGCSTLEVIADATGRMRASALSAHCNLAQLEQQAIRFTPRLLVASVAKPAPPYGGRNLPRRPEWR